MLTVALEEPEVEFVVLPSKGEFDTCKEMVVLESRTFRVGHNR